MPGTYSVHRCVTCECCPCECWDQDICRRRMPLGELDMKTLYDVPEPEQFRQACLESLGVVIWDSWIEGAVYFDFPRGDYAARDRVVRFAEQWKEKCNAG